jgi:hypothetical protein
VAEWQSARNNLQDRKEAFKKGLTGLDPWADAQIVAPGPEPAKLQRAPTMPSSSI